MKETHAMIIDVHGHTVAPPELYEFSLRVIAARGAHGRGGLSISDDRLESTLAPHLEMLDAVGTDIQFISPRPFATMHAEQPAQVVGWITQATNDVIARQVELSHGRLRGIAGLPQSPAMAVELWTQELRRCVTELGFVGCLINPDPAEGVEQMPPMGDEYWYPLYQALVDLDVPGVIHPGGNRNGRESYSNHFITEESIAVLSLIEHKVFDRFPDLKLIVCHGGGSIPYQVGRWRALRWRQWRPALDMRELSRQDTERLRLAVQDMESFDDSLRRLYFDTVLYNQESIELLLRIVGPDRCLFGTELPGTGSSVNPDTGRWLDDLKPVIESIDFLTEAGRRLVFSENAQNLFPSAFASEEAK